MKSGTVIYISNENISVVTAEAKRDVLRVVDYFQIPLKEGTMLNGVIIDENEMKRSLKTVYDRGVHETCLIVDSAKILAKAASVPKMRESEILQFVKDELAQLNHAIDQDNESRAMVNKPALPHLKYGSKAQLTDAVLAQAEEDIKAELAAEGKPEKIWDKIIPGKMDRFLLDNTKVDQAYTLLAQVYIMDDSKTVEAYLESVNASVVEFVRFEVGEGIEKASNDFESEVAATMAAALNN